MEMNDVVAALGVKGISDRAAACRELSRIGGVEHIEVLTERARIDKSPGVRLSAAAAVAGWGRRPGSRIVVSRISKRSHRV